MGVSLIACGLAARGEHSTVNVYHTGVMLNFGFATTVPSTLTVVQAVYDYSVDESSVLTVTPADYLLFNNETKHFVVFLMASTCFLLVSEWKFASVFLNRDLLCFQMAHFVGMPLMCSDTLQNSMHGVC